MQNINTVCNLLDLYKQTPWRHPKSSDVTQTSTDLTREKMFQQDARAHASKAKITWLNANIKHYISSENWPFNSSDFSLTANVWSIMATAVYSDLKSQSLQALKHCLQKAWKSISLSTFPNLIGLMPNKLIAVIMKKKTPFHTPFQWCS